MIFDPAMSGSLCVEENDRLDCLLHFPGLEAPTAGTWVAKVDKTSTPPADVDITIEWLPIG